MPLLRKLDQDLKDAMRARDQARMDTIRQVKATAMTQEIQQGSSMTDPQIEEVIGRLVRQHRESIEMFTKGNRKELVEKEKAELKVLNSYLPEQMTSAQIMELAKAAAQEVGAGGPGDRGKVMAKVMPQVKGKAEGKAVNDAVMDVLSKLS